MILTAVVSRVVAGRVLARAVGHTAVSPAFLQPLLQPVVRVFGAAAGDVKLDHTAGIAAASEIGLVAARHRGGSVFWWSAGRVALWRRRARCYMPACGVVLGF